MENSTSIIILVIVCVVVWCACSSMYKNQIEEISDVYHEQMSGFEGILVDAETLEDCKTEINSYVEDCEKQMKSYLK